MTLEERSPLKPLRTMARSLFIFSCAVVFLMMLSSSGSAAEVVVPNALASAAGNINNNLPWNCASLPSQRYQQVYLGSEVGSGTITEIAFRSNGGPFGPTTLTNVKITLSSTTAAPDTLSTIFAVNVGADVKTVYAGDLSLSSAGAGSLSPPPFNTVISLQNSFTFVAGAGQNLLLDVNIPECVSIAKDPTFFSNANFGAHSVPGDSISRAFDFVPAFPGAVDTAGLVTRFTIEPAGPPPPPTTLVAAVLPNAFAVQVGGPLPASAFVTVINTGPNPARLVGIALTTPVPASFTYQTTNALNVLIGSPNTPVDISVGGSQNFAIYITPTAPFGPTELTFAFAGSNTAPVPVLVGINTFLLLASASPTANMLALAATSPNDGIVRIPGVAGTGVFVVATSNLGIADTITVTVDTGATVVPVSVLMCQTDPLTGACLGTPAPTLSLPVAAGATPTFGFFVTGLGVSIPLDPAVNRVFVRFHRSDGLIVGGTSVAVMTL